MAKIPVDACRNSVLMPGGHYRVVPSASEVGHYMHLQHRAFPDGTTRLSFSLRGVWTICLNRDYFPRWSGHVLARLNETPGSYFAEAGKEGDVFVDAASVAAVAGESTSRRMRAAMTIVRDAAVADLVRSGVRSEMLAIFALTNDAARARRVQEILGAAPGQAGEGPTPGGEAGEPAVADDALAVDPQEDDGTDDLGRFVPVVEREVGGRMVPSVNARDMHVFLGGGYLFANWIREQVSKARLLDGQDFSRVISKNGNNPSVGRPRVEYVLTLDAAKEIGMLDKGARGKDLRLYFLDCERRLAAGEGPATPQHQVVSAPAPQLPAVAVPPAALAVDNMPLSLKALLGLKGFATSYGNRTVYVSESWDWEAHEVALVRHLLEAHVPGHSCCRHPADGSWVFTREALDAWWAASKGDVMLASLEG